MRRLREADKDFRLAMQEFVGFIERIEAFEKIGADAKVYFTVGGKTWCRNKWKLFRKIIKTYRAWEAEGQW